jgi:DNA-binding ferritin-like protein
VSDLQHRLTQFQANSVIFTNLVRGFYWNTESVLMRQSRITYRDIYENSEPAIDATSDWLRKLGWEAPYTLEEHLKNETLSSQAGPIKPKTYCGVEMAIHLVPINKVMISSLKSLIDVAYEDGEHGLVAYLSERLSKHQEWNWYLESSLKLPPNPWKSLKD